MDEAWVRSVTQTLPEGEMGPAAVYAPAENFDQGFSIPAGVGYSASCGNLRTVGAEFTGCQCVAATLLRYDYLWNEVRVKGGAYGTAMLVAEDGEVQFSSYRDPRCAQSLATFDAAGAALRHFCQSGEAPDKYIISTIGDLEKIVMPRNEAVRAAGMYFGGRTQEDLQTLRTQVLSTTVEQLEAFSRQLDALTERSNVCVIGGEAILQACGERLSSIESLQQ